MISKVGWINNTRMPDQNSAAVGYCPIDPTSCYFSSLESIPWPSSLPGGNDYLLNPVRDDENTIINSYYSDIVTGFLLTHGDTFVMTSPMYGNVQIPEELIFPGSDICLSDPWPMLYSSSLTVASNI